MSNEFPTHCLPRQLQEIIVSTYQYLDFPVDFTSASLIYASSIMTGKSICLRVKRSWATVPLFYLALVGKPGTCKSHPLKFCTEPIRSMDKRNFALYKKDKEEYQQFLDMNKEDQKTTGNTSLNEPHWHRRLATDFTPEALYKILIQNPNGIGIYLDEFATMIKNLNRYNKGSLLEFLMAAWSRIDYTIDRKSEEDPIILEKPFASIIGCIQPGILKSLFTKELLESGFVDRILFAYPDNLSKTCWSDDDLPISTINIRNQYISRLEQLAHTWQKAPLELKFSPDAWYRLKDWQNKKNKAYCDAEHNEGLTGYYSKLEDNAIRFALLLQIMQHACNEAPLDRVDLKAVEGAIELAEYFRYMGKKVYALIEGNQVQALDIQKQQYYDSLPFCFKTSEALDFGQNVGLKDRAIKAFLKKEDYFLHLEHGYYQKKF